MRDPPNAKKNNVNEVKNLELMGVQEMDAMEMRNENGGLLLTAACIGIAALYFAGTCCALSQGRNPHAGAK